MKNNNSLSSNNIKLLLYLFLFWSLAVAQPLMLLFGNQPEFLIAHETRGWNLIWLTLFLNFVFPLVIWLIVVLTGYVSKGLKEWLTRILISSLTIIIILPLVNSLSNNQAYLMALTGSIFVVFLLVKIHLFRTIAQWFSPMCIIFIFSFLFFSSAKQLLPNKNKEFQTILDTNNSPVFIFLLDEFPLVSILKSEEMVDQSRFPNISKLMKHATWYNKATTISSATDMAVPAIISGISPKNANNRMPIHDQYPDNLFSLFSSTHHINAIENNSRMCPQSLCKPLIKDPIKLLIEDVLVTFGHYILPIKKKSKLPPINDRWVGFLRELKNENEKKYAFSDRLNMFNKFVESFEMYPENTLHFLHILLPHAPWRILPDESLYAFYEVDGVAGQMEKNDPSASFAHQWNNDEWATDLSWRRHLLQIGAVDSLIGKALNRIKKLGLYDEATIIILSDHGSAFVPGLSRRYAHDENIIDIAGIPLIIKYPNQKTAITDNQLASNIDILPTLLDIFSLNKGEENIDGISLISKKKRQQSNPVYQENQTITKLPENYMLRIKSRLEEMRLLFPGDGWDGVYQATNKTDLLNLDINDLHINQTIAGAITLLNANLFSRIKKSSKYIPAYYRIKSELEEAKSNEILVAVNGKIVSHCFMFKHSPKECAGLINPNVYRKSNQDTFSFRFFSVINKNEKNRYVVNELLTANTGGAKIKSDNGKDKIQLSSGKILPIIDSQPYGSIVLRLVNNDSTYQIGGWAGNTLTGLPAKDIMVFIDNEYFTTTQTGILKPYLEKIYGFKSLIFSGFEVSLPKDQYPLLHESKIRVFALNGEESVTEVNYHIEKKHQQLMQVFDKTTNRKIPINEAATIEKRLNHLHQTANESLDVIDAFKDNFDKIASGDWYNIDNHTRWLGSSAAVIVPVNSATESISVLLTAKPLLFEGKLDVQNLEVYVDHKLIEAVEFSKINSHVIEIDLETGHEETYILIKLEMPNSASPRDFIESNDKRKLSLFLTDFRILINNANE
ncbi:MAG: sulfatase-like hydrolase/transferase [Marinicellaceae bacterium]